MTISACLIVKNEEKCLEKCLKSLQGFDEIIVCDTGSTDGTVELAKRYTDKVYTDYVWKDDFAEARNHAKSKATGDYILTIDADEWLERNGVKKIRKEIQSGLDAYDIKCVGSKNDIHYQPRLYRNRPEVKWHSAVHNYLSVVGQKRTNIVTHIGYSPAHYQDPDRSLRILTKEYEKNPKHARILYYLAREYFYRSDWIKAVYYWEECVKYSKVLTERADAYLFLARCYWNMAEWEKAREKCLFAILLDPNFEEAFIFLAEVSWPHQAKRWYEIAGTASSEDCIFLRVDQAKRVYYNPAMKTFGEALVRMGFTKYNQKHDTTRPCFFEGLYFQEDYEIYKNHKGPKVVYWNGSDVLRLLENPQWIQILKENPGRHITYHEWYQNKLMEVGIGSEIFPIFFGKTDDFPVSFKPGNEVYMTAHPGREEEYGVPLAIELCAKTGLKLHIYGIDGENTENVTYHGEVPEAQMNKEIREFQGALKFNKAMGRSQTYIKSLLLGQYPIDINDGNLEEKLEKIKTYTEPNTGEQYQYNQFDWIRELRS